ncbi:LysR family transcriptional regulator [Devosia ginsengisoli]|uniref:LysR family transcriptional regulator n=1 Tax=Devosia ginsengisoli TaxID=400770 RepID=A0A5B8LWV3_9HYPH|nr:LysR family transcriptional regulator [Devosia ginsengisoli]QDZ11972.1 LysR family transcriptional regulator [Devosia ginsengisoli]
MARSPFDDMQAFLAVARERSFTRAAARLGVTPSALSHAMKGLEERLGLRLLSRTTRSVSTTEAGERLARSIGPHFEQIEAEIAALSDLRDRPAGTIRISCGDSLVEAVFRPMLRTFLRDYPDITVELAISNGFVDIVAQGLDAGVRLGEALSKDMIAVRIGPDWRFTVVAAPQYFERRDPPLTPQDLTNHQCVNLRLTTAGGLYAWEFRKDGRDLNVRVDGQLIFNSILPVLGAALDGHGLAYVPEYMARPHIERGDLIEVLSDWSITWQGYHLYYPNRRHPSPAFAALVNALRYKA